jgi:hypothetical protein
MFHPPSPPYQALFWKPLPAVLGHIFNNHIPIPVANQGNIAKFSYKN